MTPKSLHEMATAVATKNIRSIVSVGYMSYPSVRHILAKIEDARQLRQIELNCPQLQGETAELWLRLIERDFPLELRAHAYMPKHADRWFKVWERYKADHDRSLHASEEQLRAALSGLREDKEGKKSRIVEGRFLPSDATRPRRRPLGPKDGSTSVLSFGGGSRTKTLTGAGVMRKARREAREVRNIQGALSRSVVAPIRLLEKQHLTTRSPAATISQPPPGMVREHRIAAQPAYRTPEAEASEKRAEELARKRAEAVIAEHAKHAAYITDSEEEDDWDNGDDDYHRQPAKRPSAAASAPSNTAAAKPPPPAPGRKVPGSGGNMFQRKFGAGKGTLKAPPPPQPLRRVTTTTTAAAASSSSPPPSAGRKRTAGAANLDEPTTSPSSASKRPAISSSTSQVLPREPSPPADFARGLSPTKPEAPKLLPRKKKPVSVFMKRPVKRT
ncbi:RNA polymerase II transcription factor SIII (Elongin) subunit A [Cordyceps fumosorosea ARSEF 2679]|uniref:RNA polymerase II transcription factor SIII (Elongin) subunit A n=1 Tax=Cordyceps fumosorosea (strain ARSEF 2679) TaxID=1081104 RepID=A0A167XFW8_CORFA|nr:RNA polymerase II transcription factor SIII (Elongin) subunit A [Cordyceps fumosorosea ARSEF 2679]OAA64931.1 RNA polymerase II transcription factor SIII (Elongin) subunit A [Cordyceps fumosorosea ARSEF 2679]